MQSELFFHLTEHLTIVTKEYNKIQNFQISPRLQQCPKCNIIFHIRHEPQNNVNVAWTSLGFFTALLPEKNEYGSHKIMGPRPTLNTVQTNTTRNYYSNYFSWKKTFKARNRHSLEQQLTHCWKILRCIIGKANQPQHVKID